MNNSSKRNEAIRECVYNFYAKNRKLCDACYIEAEDENIDQLYVDENELYIQNTLLAQTAVVVLTANKYERNILHKKAFKLQTRKIRRMEIELPTACQRFKKTYAYWFEWGDYKVLNIHANVTGSYTIGGAADIIRWVLANEYLLPTSIVSFGVCFGTKESDNELGDVVISRKVYPYFIGVKADGKKLPVVDDNAFTINDKLDNKIRNLNNNNKLNKFRFNVLFKNYITGEAVVSSKFYRDKFVSITTQEIIAGDMEGYGLFKECMSAPYNIPCMVIKSICDWGMEKNFNEKDANVLSQFNTVLSTYNVECSDEDMKALLKTLKDRLQAYASNCAFDVLDVIIKNDILDMSVFDNIKAWIGNYHGVATTCKTIREELIGIVNRHGLGFSISDSYLHKCLIILEKEGLIRCESKCRLEQDGNEKCILAERNASIDIIAQEG